MPHIVKTVNTGWTTGDAFAYMADFSHTAEWDPGVVDANRVDVGALGHGSAFDVTVRVGGRRMPMRYEITAFAPDRVTFTSRTSMLESVDTVTVARRGETTEVTYDARINFRGILRLADPLLALGFRGVADRAVGGLERRLSEAA